VFDTDHRNRHAPLLIVVAGLPHRIVDGQQRSRLPFGISGAMLGQSAALDRIKLQISGVNDL
jgi:hypothetical protein